MDNHIVNNNGSYNSRFYTLNNTDYEIVGTLSTGNLAIQSMDTIKNIKTGKLKEIERKLLFSFTREQ